LGRSGAKTISLESARWSTWCRVYGNCVQRLGRVIGFGKYRVDSDRPIDVWLEEFARSRRTIPKHMLIASIMEEYERSRQELTRMVQDTGVDAFELNFPVLMA